MNNITISPLLAANLKTCEAAIRCLDTIQHDDLRALQAEISERMDLTIQELRTYMQSTAEPHIESLRSYVIAYCELEYFVSGHLKSVLMHLHHIMHVRTDDAYCRRVADHLAASDAPATPEDEGLDGIRNLVRMLMGGR